MLVAFLGGRLILAARLRLQAASLSEARIGLQLAAELLHRTER
jgi:hypothetical protein